MFKALVLKELRETGWIALVALAAHLAYVANICGYSVLPFLGSSRNEEIPFIQDGTFTGYFCLVSIALAAALGLRQTVGESVRGTWLFLLHRPAGLWQVLAAKLAVGWGLYLLCGIVPILAYAAWAATPGTHASPFYWWMTADAWPAWGVIALVYPAAFLTGIRPARWFGTRLLPLVAAGPLAILSATVFYSLRWPLVGMTAILVFAIGLIGLIHFTARTRDFS